MPTERPNDIGILSIQDIVLITRKDNSRPGKVNHIQLRVTAMKGQLLNRGVISRSRGKKIANMKVVIITLRTLDLLNGLSVIHSGIFKRFISSLVNC